MYAVIETGGKQYKVQNGDVIFVEKLDVEAGDKLTFDKVIAFKDRTLKVGTPYVKGATVEATVVKNGKGKKVTVFTYRPKKGSKRCLGHRQPYTQIQIDSMGVEKATKTAAAESAE
ncbi:MAG: 50S ribosomal protein L21 [Acutalibacteraceae bacterium]|nr:50S ribosomal protein L21 [Acutalibacteraceae bacterium]